MPDPGPAGAKREGLPSVIEALRASEQRRAEGALRLWPIRPSSWALGAQIAEEEKRTYQDKLEGASSDSVFKYVFLINNAAVEKYVQQSREQADSAFRLSQRVAVAGFALLGVSIAIGLVSQFKDQSLTTAYLAGVGGGLTEFIGGVFFWLYNRTLQQINLFYQGMMTQQHDALAAIGRSSESAAKAATKLGGGRK